MKLKRYTGVFIDWSGTLSRSLFWGQWSDPCHSCHALFARISEILFASQSPFTAEWMVGEKNAEAICDILAARVGCSSHMLLQGLKESCEAMQLVDGQVLPLIHGLRSSGVKVILATDNMDTFCRWTVPSLNLRRHFDQIADSFTLGRLKGDLLPSGDSPFFDPFLYWNHLKPAEVVLVDDSCSMKEVAGRIGMGFRQVSQEASLVSILAELLYS